MIVTMIDELAAGEINDIVDGQMDLSKLENTFRDSKTVRMSTYFG